MVYPLLGLTVTGSPSAVGWLGFAMIVAVLAFYIPGGLLVDRLPRRSIMLFAESGRCAAVFTILLSTAFGGPLLAHIVSAAFVEGALFAMYGLAETALLSDLVRPELRKHAVVKVRLRARSWTYRGDPSPWPCF